MKSLVSITIFLLFLWGTYCPSEQLTMDILVTVEDTFEYINCNLTGPTCKDDCTDLEDGLYQFCGNCSFFLICSGQNTFMGECPEDLEWDDLEKSCDEQSSTCEECYTRADCLSTGPSCIRDCEGMPDNEYQMCQNCTSYAVCENGLLSIEHCPLGEVWHNFDPKGCVSKSETCVECYEVVNCDSTGPACINNCQGKANGVYQSCKTCLGFLSCVSGNGTLGLCPVGSIWDDNNRGCYEKSTTCQQCVSVDKCLSTGSICVQRCTGLDDGFYQSCTNCSSYVRCYGGHTFYESCTPSDWFWDNNARTCFRDSSTCTECEDTDEGNTLETILLFNHYVFQRKFDYSQNIY